MSEDDLPPDATSAYLAAKLARLERLLDEQGARLRAVEQQLGLAAPPRPFGQGRAAERRDPLNGQHEPVLPPPAPRSVTDEPTHTHAAPPSFTATTTDTEHAAAADEPTARASVTADEPGTAPGATMPDWRATEAAREGEARRAEYDGNADGRRAEREQAAGASADSARPAAGVAASAAGARARVDLESLIGGRWFSWLGIIAVIVGVSFALKYAFDQGWLGPLGRVLLGGVAGCALLALAERLRLRGYQAYAYVLSGGGIVILYLSVYAAFGFYHLIGQPFAFALMALVTATAVALAARYDAYAIAVLGLVGGFMTPKLLATNVDNEIGLFGYAALLDAGVLALAYFKRWRSLNYLAFAATWLLFGGWYAKFYADAKLAPTLFFLTLFFVMFAALAVVHNVVKQRPARWFDISLTLTNATLYFATSYYLLEDHRLNTPGAWQVQGAHALLVAAFFGLLYFVARAKHPADRLLTYTYVGLCVTFLTMALAIQLDQQWVTIAWGVEALMLTWVGLKAEEDAPRFAALPVFAVALLHWFAVDFQDFGYQFDGPVFHPLLNKRAVACAVLVLVCAGTTWLYRRYADRVDKDDRDILRSVFALAGNALALALLTADVSDYFRQAITRELGAGGTGGELSNAHQFALTALVAVYAAGALAVGVVRRLAALRLAALAVLVYPVLKVLLADVWFYSAAWHTLVFNWTFAGFAVVVLALAACVRAYARAGDVNARERQLALGGLLAAANVVALTGLSVEFMGYFNRAKALAWGLPDAWHEAARVENNKQLALSALWTIYAAVAFVLGLRRGRQAVRAGALGLLALAGLKILLVDATYYNATWHAPLLNQTALAFALYVAALWLVARLYARAGGTAAAEAARVLPVITVVGNVFALAGLSLETSGYFAAQRRAGAVAAGQLRDLRLAQQLALSVLWALYGGAMLVVGLARRNRLLRLLALLLLGLTTAKVFFVDLSSLDKVYRIISFIVLGAILLAVSFLYQQRQQRAARAEGG
ncbi:MAG TPA: DUF2339 domain-containing protein [Pyrinomonadaceae bacterium]|jgi:uncharacterized membrane protein